MIPPGDLNTHINSTSDNSVGSKTKELSLAHDVFWKGHGKKLVLLVSNHLMFIESKIHASEHK